MLYFFCSERNVLGLFLTSYEVIKVKPSIHPEYNKTTITCACGAVYHVGSTKKNIRVEICSKCHPFWTGMQKIVDTAGRVEKFRRKYGYLEGEAVPQSEAKKADENQAEAH